MKDLSIFEKLCFSTTRIETEDFNGNNFSGTGFFYNLSIDDKMMPLIVTNKHVVRGMKKGIFRFTKSDSQGNPIFKEHFIVPIDLNFEKMWLVHPDENVDLCVLPINPLLLQARELGNNLFYCPLDDSLIPTKKNLEEIDAAEDIIMIGYPNGLWDSVNNMPIVRKGTTATLLNLDYEGKKEFLIDAACFPGSSGSPVLICNVGGYKDRRGGFIMGGTRIFLLGVLYAGPQLTVTGEIEIVTIPNIHQKPMAVSRIPNNLGYIIKSECIMDFKEVVKQKMK